MKPITVLAPTGSLGYGFDPQAFERGMSLKPDAIAVDSGSSDPGPHYLGSGDLLVSRFGYKRELTELIRATKAAGIPLVVSSAGGAGTKTHVDAFVDLVREIAGELRLNRTKIAWIYADIPKDRIKEALGKGEVKRFEADFDLTAEHVEQSTNIVAQMGHEPIVDALEKGAEIVIAGRACDDACIAAYPIWKGADPGLSLHMGKILECGAFSAVPFAMDTMLGTVDADGFTLEPGGLNRRASLTSVAAHTLYEREDPIHQEGPGYALDLSRCRFEQANERQVRVTGSRFVPGDGHWIKLEGARRIGYRTLSIAGIRCPTMIAKIDEILAAAKAKCERYFAPQPIQVGFHVYGRDGVMRALEPGKRIQSHELGLVMEVVAADQELAHAACHQLSGNLLHVHYEGQINTSGNLAFPYSPSEVDAGPAYVFSAYHLMKTRTPLECFPIHHAVI
ncbi:MAG: DUF1446 domain-containing protein [Alphaproteobacteria bacterium]|nr:DUF1446 domain-containing protein [Alphaproteobacteria bacterium]